MGDSTINAINRFYDLVDKGVDAADQVLNSGKQIEDKSPARQATRRTDVIDVEATPKKTPKKTTAVIAKSEGKKARFYIVESISPTGETRFVVTDGGDARTECATREFAEKVMRALEGG